MPDPAILLPGQGAQFEGMGRDWAEAFETARTTFEEADSILGFSLSEACWSSGEQVNRTDIAQPGILTTSVAILRVLTEQGLDPSAAAMTSGLSLGEYTALWVAGSIDFPDALRLVRLRGEAMQAASELVPSGMTSLMGAQPEQAEAVAAVGAQVGVCQVANMNAPGQIILSGEISALEAAEAAAKEHGVRRTRRLVVAGGFHSECMRPAADRLGAALADVSIDSPRITFVSNVTAGPTEDPAAIRKQLADQICSPVLWEKSMRWALDQGIKQYLEPGPGAVLAGLMAKIDKEATVVSRARPSDLEGD